MTFSPSFTSSSTSASEGFTCPVAGTEKITHLPNLHPGFFFKYFCSLFCVLCSSIIRASNTLHLFTFHLSHAFDLIQFPSPVHLSPISCLCTYTCLHL